MLCNQASIWLDISSTSDRELQAVQLRVRSIAMHEFGVSPGQACVIYDGAAGSRVLGGGFITRG